MLIYEVKIGVEARLLVGTQRAQRTGRWRKEKLVGIQKAQGHTKGTKEICWDGRGRREDA